MAFVNEVVSDADIEAYGLPFEKGKGHWWTRDKERDLYLWGGEYGNPAWGDEVEGHFCLFIDGRMLRLALSFGVWSKNWYVRPFIVSWDRLLWIDPPDCYSIDRLRVLNLLRESLIAYGRDGRENRNTPDRIVRFGF